MSETIATFLDVAKAFYGFGLIVLGTAFLAVTPVVLRVIRGLTTAVELHANALQGTLAEKDKLDAIAHDVATIKSDVQDLKRAA
jgi:hypothetical protein